MAAASEVDQDLDELSASAADDDVAAASGVDLDLDELLEAVSSSSDDNTGRICVNIVIVTPHK